MSISAQENAILGAVVGSLPASVFILDENGRYLEVLCNQSQGPSDDTSMVGRRLHDVLPEPVAAELLESIRHALDTQTTWVEEYQLADEEDVPQWFEGRFTPLPTEHGKPRRVAWVALDITERKRLENQLAESSLLDPLTGLSSRRHFLQVLDNEIVRQARYDEPFCLLLLEIEHFDTIRNTYGEHVGDQCLIEAARLISQQLRHSDVPGRIEGAEFGVLLLNTPLQWGVEVGERIRARITRSPISLPSRTLHLTVSAGVTDVRERDTASDLLWRAEEALYKSENAGQDRISVA